MYFVALSLLMISTLISAEPHFTSCPDTANNYELNSTFEKNLKSLFDSLPLKTSLNEGFYNSSVGNGTNIVYVQALCRGDVTSKVCHICVQNASQEIMKQCQRDEAIIWYELCQIRYSYSNFFGSNVYTGKYPDSDYKIKNVSDPARFHVVWMNFMKNLTARVAFGPSELMFATAKTKFSESETIYGLVQCTRDVSREICKICLDSAFGDLDGCCGSRQGGTVFSRSCNMRFELYQFYSRSSANNGNKWKMRITVIVVSLFVLAVLIGCYVFCTWWRKKSKKDEEISQGITSDNLAAKTSSVLITEDCHLVTSQELPFLELGVLKAATNNFSDSNKLGRGGFGTVYKGILVNGKPIAVKRLSRKSWQGTEEFKNEIMLIVQLQHRNLVRLWGGSIEGDEKLLIYEYMCNKSLDIFIFDANKRSQLDWAIRLSIINGIARGLLYLHEESRLKIIHRDLKPSNILLDHQMVAKISDFGMAKIFCEDQNIANTKIVVGTYGYMAPEYAMEGLFSVKSDVFSFGVILLEIISGKRNSGFYLKEQAQTLLAYAWRLWNEGKELEFVDPLLTELCSTAEVVRFILIGLLCVQEDPADRPTMSSVVIFLESESLDLPKPNKPAFSLGKFVRHIDRSSSTDPSINQATISSILPR